MGSRLQVAGFRVHQRCGVIILTSPVEVCAYSSLEQFRHGGQMALERGYEQQGGGILLGGLA